MSDILELLDSINNDDADEQTQVNYSRQDIQEIKSFTIMLNYIKEHKTDVPEQFRSTVTRDLVTGLTLAMHWVYIMHTAPVPTWMQHDPNITDSHGWCVAMHYIVANKSQPPKWMQNTSDLQNVNGKTTAMLYLLYRSTELQNTEIPDWMKHDLHIFDADGYSLVDDWLFSNTEPLPDWLISDVDKDFKNNRGETIEQSIQHCKQLKENL